MRPIPPIPAPLKPPGRARATIGPRLETVKRGLHEYRGKPGRPSPFPFSCLAQAARAPGETLDERRGDPGTDELRDVAAQSGDLLDQT